MKINFCCNGKKYRLEFFDDPQSVLLTDIEGNKGKFISVTKNYTVKNLVDFIKGGNI